MNVSGRWSAVGERDHYQRPHVRCTAVLILLPPSEGKTRPEDGPPADLDSMSFPELTGERVDMLAALVHLCRRQPGAAGSVLGLGPRQADEVTHNAELTHAPAAPARDVYSGVLYDALNLPGITGPAAERAESSVVIMSGLWGALRPPDVIPAYRLAGNVNLPDVGKAASFWRPALAKSLPAAAGDEMIVDLRSGTYVPFWRPGNDLAERCGAIRVLHERDGQRSVVSHHNKATKGHIARQLLEAATEPSSPASLADLLTASGWRVEVSAPTRAGSSTTIDVVVTEVETLAGVKGAARNR